MKQYEKYKDSGIDWLKEIPEHWELNKLKYEVSLTNNKVLSQDSKLTYTGMENIESGTGRYIVTDSEAEGLANYFTEGDILFGKLRPYLAKVFLAQKEGICSTEFLVFRCNESNSNHFFHKLLLSPNFIDAVNSSTYGAKMPRANSEFLNNLKVPVPSPSEQTTIASFLDHKTAQIDALIEKKEQLIEKLRLQRQAIINEAVTKGLNPNATMKESGIEWLGEIPEHWEVVKLKHLFEITGGGTPNKQEDEFWNGTIPWVSPKDMKVDLITTTEDFITDEGLANSTTNLIDEGNLLMVVRSGILQRTIPIAITGTPVTVNQDIKAFTSRGRVSSNYLFYFIKGNELNLLNEIVKQGATVESVEIDFLANTSIVFPSIAEQNQIVDYLDEKEQYGEQVIHKLRQSIDKLKLYRQSLISEAVTGKIDVRDWAEEEI